VVLEKQMRAIENLTTPGAVGVVVIGRNEGERLRRCLNSVHGSVNRVVYVDSGSSDGSVELARELGVAVAELDLTTPFTAARARNIGFQHLLGLEPHLDQVFFVDGDCEVCNGWVEAARQFLVEHTDVGIVWGRRRERYPDRSIYNMLCDIEWSSFPIGETKACGGDAVVRVEAFRQVNGYRSSLICGEEPEMCLRMRQNGWRIWHLDKDMTLHDAAIYRFGQWWKRMLRGGYGFAQGAALHGARPERHWVVESRRAWFWGLCVPLIMLLMAFVVGWWTLLLLLAYPAQLVRLAGTGRRFTRVNWLWAGAMVLGKFPEMLGQVKYLRDRCLRVNSHLIEYK
jgi:glycosyltransferase involved in cell wall biosynthesis